MTVFAGYEGTMYKETIDDVVLMISPIVDIKEREDVKNHLQESRDPIYPQPKQLNSKSRDHKAHRKLDKLSQSWL